MVRTVKCDLVRPSIFRQSTPISARRCTCSLRRSREFMMPGTVLILQKIGMNSPGRSRSSKWYTSSATQMPPDFDQRISARVVLSSAQIL